MTGWVLTQKVQAQLYTSVIPRLEVRHETGRSCGASQHSWMGSVRDLSQGIRGRAVVEDAWHGPLASTYRCTSHVHTYMNTMHTHTTHSHTSTHNKKETRFTGIATSGIRPQQRVMIHSWLGRNFVPEFFGCLSRISLTGYRLHVLFWIWDASPQTDVLDTWSPPGSTILGEP